jgi:hypothetical protein
MHYIFTFLFFNPYINVDYKPPEDDPVRVETHVGVEE